MECEKLAQEKTEMQRHYVMVSWKLVFPLNFRHANNSLSTNKNRVSRKNSHTY